MDLAKLDVRAAAEKGAVLTLQHPATGQDLEATIEVVGRDSSSVRGRLLELDRAKAAGQEVTDKERSLELMVACIKGWSGVEMDGEPLEFSHDNARKLLEDPRTEWIAEQIGPFVLRRRNFAANYPTA